MFLGPFLEVIRSEDTSGPITGLALSSLNKFLSYNLFGMSAKCCWLLCCHGFKEVIHLIIANIFSQ